MSTEDGKVSKSEQCEADMKETVRKKIANR